MSKKYDPSGYLIITINADDIGEGGILNLSASEDNQLLFDYLKKAVQEKNHLNKPVLLNYIQTGELYLSGFGVYSLGTLSLKYHDATLESGEGITFSYNSTPDDEYIMASRWTI